MLMIGPMELLTLEELGKKTKTKERKPERE
jgi:hypothetical protein